MKKLISKLFIICCGYTPESADETIKNKFIYQKSNWKFWKKYLFLDQLSGKYRNLTNDRLLIRYALPQCKDILPDYFLQALKRNGTCKYVSLHDNETGNNDILTLLNEKEHLILAPSLCSEQDYIIHLKKTDEKYYINGQTISISNLEEYIRNIRDTDIILGSIDESAAIKYSCGSRSSKLVLIVDNSDWKTPEVLSSFLSFRFDFTDSEVKILSKDEYIVVDRNGYISNGFKIPQWEKAVTAGKKIASELKELEFLGVELILTDNGVKVWKISNLPAIPESSWKNSKLKSFIDNKTIQLNKSVKIKKKIFSVCKYIYSCIAEHYGYMGFMMKNWHRDLVKDWLKTKKSLKDKLWSHKRGFLSFRINQYGLNESNYSEFLSDRDYRKMRPINNQFVRWVYDKVVTRYVLEQKKEYIPKYYYHLLYRNGKQIITPLPDCPNNCNVSMAGIINLLHQKKKLIVKPSEGSHGEGILKLEYKDGIYYVNNKELSKDELTDKIIGLKGYFNISEFVEMNSFLKTFYDKTTYTVRIMVINESGDAPWLANAYLRIATDSTGVTDNISDGGVCARIEMDSGKIFEPEQIINHVIKPCPIHPDSGAEIIGYIPNWDKIKDGIKEIAEYTCQLEYMGFDVVVTEEGFKVLEINTHQDLHRYPHYGDKVHEYFVRKDK